ncbi:MAG: acetolactate synthase small subunit [Bacteroides sp.]|nr:acetolactate synthase small subunit [Bacteroides sp.]MDD2645279.1 acetolactate synthase small subunit [Bacteroides sp.]MDD4054573.1 acetolactate synthase small subunit [Bacteroides sp.]MDD4720285.1 acetolactate synthase small subunit [Bacteroides sp.]
MKETLYTLTVHSENIAGVLNQITTIFTRRQLNIESLNVSASALEGIHKYTITTYSDEATIKKVTKQIEKIIDVLQADYFTDNEIFYREVALYKIPTQELVDSNSIENLISKHNARIIEINDTYTVIQKAGTTEETANLYYDLDKIGILQFVRSGRIAITKSPVEKLNNYLAYRKEQYEDLKNKNGK